MKAYIDCEFNGFQGELISMAIVTESGDSWYEVLCCNDPVEWVEKNVIPVLYKEPISKIHMQSSLSKFINRYDELTIIADWPEDIKYFCELIITGPGLCIKTPKLKFEIISIGSMDEISEIPHNALSDAKAISKSWSNIH